MERRSGSKGHSQTGEGRGQDWSGYGKVSQQGTLTCWRGQRSELVKTWKESKEARGTHFLERSEAMTGQGIERRQAGKGHSLPEGGRGQDGLGHRNKARQQGALTCWRGQRSGLFRA